MRYRFLMLQLLSAGNDSIFYRFNTTVDLFSCTEPIDFAQTFCTCTDKGYEASPFLWRYFPESGKSLNEDQKSEMKGLDKLVWKDRGIWMRGFYVLFVFSKFCNLLIYFLPATEKRLHRQWQTFRNERIGIYVCALLTLRHLRWSIVTVSTTTVDTVLVRNVHSVYVTVHIMGECEGWYV